MGHHLDPKVTNLTIWIKINSFRDNLIDIMEWYVLFKACWGNKTSRLIYNDNILEIFTNYFIHYPIIYEMT